MTMTPKKTPTAQGRPVTDDLVDQLADEAEAGYDVHSLKRTGGRKPIGSAAPRA
jgi:hypothetical protein